jgi:MOSC domain-containing protein YiiM
MMQGTITQVSISKGGVPKLSIGEAWAGRLGLEGDAHRNLKHHGGPRKALLLVSSEDLEDLRKVGIAVGPGDLGENLTVEGIDFRQLREGQRFRAGGAILALTTVRKPCGTLDVYDGGRSGATRGAIAAVAARGGYYAEVLQEGLIRAGDIMSLVDQQA